MSIFIAKDCSPSLLTSKGGFLCVESDRQLQCQKSQPPPPTFYHKNDQAYRKKKKTHKKAHTFAYQLGSPVANILLYRLYEKSSQPAVVHFIKVLFEEN